MRCLFPSPKPDSHGPPETLSRDCLLEGVSFGRKGRHNFNHFYFYQKIYHRDPCVTSEFLILQWYKVGQSRRWVDTVTKINGDVTKEVTRHSHPYPWTISKDKDDHGPYITRVQKTHLLTYWLPCLPPPSHTMERNEGDSGGVGR